MLPVEGEERKSPENTVAQSPTTNPTPKALFPEPQAPPKDNNEDNERDTNDIKTTQRQITFNMIQAMQTPGKQDKEIDVDKNTAEDPKKVDAAHVMINGCDPTQWVTVNTDMGTRVGCEYETTTQNTKDIDAFTVHITPRAMLKRWDTGPVEGQPWVPIGSTVGPRFLAGIRGSPAEN